MKYLILFLTLSFSLLASGQNNKATITMIFESHKNCIPSWLSSPKLTVYGEESVIMGYNTKNENVILFITNEKGENKLKSRNLVTNEVSTVECTVISKITNNSASDYKVKVDLNNKSCINVLRNYLSNALEYRARVQSRIAPNYREMRKDIVKCAGAGIYDDFEGFTKESLGAKVKDELQPFGFLKGGEKLTWKQIKKILVGKNKLLGPNPKQSRPSSPYLIPELL